MPSDWASLPALTRWKSGEATSSSAASGAASASATILWVSGPNGSRCWGLVVRVLRSVSWSVHSWSEMTAFQGSMMICSPSSMALARTTSSSAVRSATLPISLRYIRTGSSIPIMSADRASSSSAVGSSTSAGVELGRRVHAGGTTLVSAASTASSVTISTLSSAVLGSASSSADRSMSSSSRSSSSTSSETGAADAVGAPRAHRRELRLLELAPSPAWASRARTASTSCLSRGSAMSAGPPSSSVEGSVWVEVSPPPPACGRGVGSGRGAGRATGAVR